MPTSQPFTVYDQDDTVLDPAGLAFGGDTIVAVDAAGLATAATVGSGTVHVELVSDPTIADDAAVDVFPYGTVLDVDVDVADLLAKLAAEGLTVPWMRDCRDGWTGTTGDVTGWGPVVGTTGGPTFAKLGAGNVTVDAVSGRIVTATDAVLRSDLTAELALDRAFVMVAGVLTHDLSVIAPGGGYFLLLASAATAGGEEIRLLAGGSNIQIARASSPAGAIEPGGQRNGATGAVLPSATVYPFGHLVSYDPAAKFDYNAFGTTPDASQQQAVTAPFVSGVGQLTLGGYYAGTSPCPSEWCFVFPVLSPLPLPRRAVQYLEEWARRAHGVQLRPYV